MPPDSGASTFRVAADAYDRHVGRYSARLAEGMLEIAGVRPGHDALDVGCGPGALTRALVERLGPGRVTAVDPSEPFVEACRARVPEADVHLAAAESLPFEDSRFDVVLSQLVVNFMDDPEAGASEMRRVAKPGRVVASSVWDYAGEMKLLRAFWDAALGLELPGAEERHEGTAMRFSTPEELGGLWREAGLVEVTCGPLEVAADYRDFDDLWSPLERGVGPAGAFAAGLEPAQRRELREEMWRKLGAPREAFQLTARAWYVRGTAPA